MNELDRFVGMIRYRADFLKIGPYFLFMMKAFNRKSPVTIGDLWAMYDISIQMAGIDAQ
jgi:hypothetical protein